METPSSAPLETDPRFPSGPWTGFFNQKQGIRPGKHTMELQLTFRTGEITGGGRDWVGEFIIKGRYSIEDGTCYWTKRYVGRHDVFYRGFNEGQGIWGTWEIPQAQNLGMHWTGGFHIWPEGMGDPTGEYLGAQAELPGSVQEEKPNRSPALV